MASIALERTVGPTKRAVLNGLSAFNTERMGKQRFKQLAVSLKDRGKVVGGIVGQVWSTVLFVQYFWIDEKWRGKRHGTKLMTAIEDEARRLGATQAYVDTMSFQAPGFYRSCGYSEFGAIEGYPGGVTRHWFTKAL